MHYTSAMVCPNCYYYKDCMGLQVPDSFSIRLATDRSGVLGKALSDNKRHLISMDNELVMRGNNGQEYITLTGLEPLDVQKYTEVLSEVFMTEQIAQPA